MNYDVWAEVDKQLDKNYRRRNHISWNLHKKEKRANTLFRIKQCFIDEFELILLGCSLVGCVYLIILLLNK